MCYDRINFEFERNVAKTYNFGTWNRPSTCLIPAEACQDRCYNGEKFEKFHFRFLYSSKLYKPSLFQYYPTTLGNNTPVSVGIIISLWHANRFFILSFLYSSFIMLHKIATKDLTYICKARKLSFIVCKGLHQVALRWLLFRPIQM